jgi:hydroxymethylbilane synthase
LRHNFPALKKEIIIGSRGSDLALWQANHVKAQLESLGLTCNIHIIKTKGDQIQHLSFDKIEGKGFFTKEIEEALLQGEIDLAVHSHKDLETSQPDGLTIAAVSEREDPSELLLIHPDSFDPHQKYGMKEKAEVGTSSARRKAQLLRLRPDVTLKDIRGNVPTRVQKLRDGHYDAIMLANAGVKRLDLDLSGLHAIVLSPFEFVPAPAQGVLAIQCREEDNELSAVISKISDEEVRKNIHIERAVLNRLQGGCQLPLGVFVTADNGTFSSRVAFAKSWDAPVLRFDLESDNSDQLISAILEKIHAEK